MFLSNHSPTIKDRIDPILRVVLISPNVSLIQTFYEKLGARFSSDTFYNNISWKISTNTNICIIKSSKEFPTSPGGLVLFRKSSDLIIREETYAYDPHSKLSLLKIPVPTDQFHHLISTENSSWASILRSSSIENTKIFFNALGTWVKEKHGSGPFHYSLTTQNQLFEIYPLRKTYFNTLEFTVKTTKNMLLSFPSHVIKLRNEKQCLIEDPDQRLINFLF